MQILFAENHILLREALKPQIGTLAPDVDFVDASSLADVLKALKSGAKPDLIILDFLLPGLDGAYGVGLLSRDSSSGPIVILSGRCDVRLVNATIDAGAQGFIPKTVSVITLVNALRLVLSGERYIPPTVLIDNAIPEPQNLDDSPPDFPNERVARLTEREQEVLNEIVRGKTNPQIAQTFGISLSQANVYVRNVYRRIGVDNRAGAVRVALRAG